MNPLSLSPVANHLWQSTLFAAVAGLLTLTLRRNRARVRHAVWLAASIKFLIPLSALIALGSYIPWRTTPGTAQSNVTIVMDKVSMPFVVPAASSRLLETAPPARSPLPDVLAIIWLGGFLGITCSWSIRWRRIRGTVRAGSPMQLKIPIRTISSPTSLEPGVFGIFRPVLLLPQGIFDRLTPSQMEAVIAHELCHVRHRDNLSAAIQMFVETVFWFHPLVWWMGNQMTEERERACDEEVLRLGSEPRAYAEGILNICKLYVESPLVCVSGITGPNLRKRIETIMANRIGVRLNFAKKLALAAAGIGALAVPIVIGTMNAPSVRAQSPAAVLNFEVTSVKPANPDQGSKLNCTGGKGFVAWNQTLLSLIHWSYDLPYGGKRVAGGPKWLDSPGSRFEIQGKVARKVSSDECRLMVQALLSDRFKLALHRETKELPVYVLSVGRNGSKMREAKDPSALSSVTLNGAEIQVGDGYHTTASGRGMSMEELARFLSNIPAVGRTVIDRTGLKGFYGFKLDYSETAGDLTNPNIFTAVQDELGLKLRAAKAPVEILVIDQAEKPSPN